MHGTGPGMDAPAMSTDVTSGILSKAAGGRPSRCGRWATRLTKRRSLRALFSRPCAGGRLDGGGVPNAVARQPKRSVRPECSRECGTRVA